MVGEQEENSACIDVRVCVCVCCYTTHELDALTSKTGSVERLLLLLCS